MPSFWQSEIEVPSIQVGLAAWPTRAPPATTPPCYFAFFRVNVTLLFQRSAFWSHTLQKRVTGEFIQAFCKDRCCEEGFGLI